MSITPIEMYSMIPKSQEASNLRHGEVAKDASQQAGAMQQYSRNINDNSQRTVSAKKSDNPEYRYDNKDGSGNKGGYNADRRKKEPEKKASKEPSGMMESGRFDIRI